MNIQTDRLIIDDLKIQIDDLLTEKNQIEMDKNFYEAKSGGLQKQFDNLNDVQLKISENNSDII